MLPEGMNMMTTASIAPAINTHEIIRMRFDADIERFGPTIKSSFVRVSTIGIDRPRYNPRGGGSIRGHGFVASPAVAEESRTSEPPKKARDTIETMSFNDGLTAGFDILAAVYGLTPCIK